MYIFACNCLFCNRMSDQVRQWGIEPGSARLVYRRDMKWMKGFGGVRIKNPCLELTLLILLRTFAISLSMRDLLDAKIAVRTNEEGLMGSLEAISLKDLRYTIHTLNWTASASVTRMQVFCRCLCFFFLQLNIQRCCIQEETSRHGQVKCHPV